MEIQHSMLRSYHAFAKSHPPIDMTFSTPTDGMRRPVSGRDAVRSQVIDVLKAQIKRRPAMKKVSTVAVKATQNFSESKLTIGLDLGDRSSWYCLLDEVGEVVS